MEAQEIFDKVKTHLLTQNKKALLGNNCLYLTPDGLKCAAGCLIPDGHPAQRAFGPWPHQPCIERFDVTDTALQQLSDEIGHHDLVRALQVVHDYTSPELWPQQLRAVAERFGLVYGD